MRNKSQMIWRATVDTRLRQKFNDSIKKLKMEYDDDNNTHKIIISKPTGLAMEG